MTATEHLKPMTKNERRAFRYAVGLPAGYMVYDEWYGCDIVDASSRGAAVKTKQVLLQGDSIKLRISFDNRSALIDARVAYSSGMKIGLVFAQDDRDGIESFLTLLDDILVFKARVEVKEYFSHYGDMKLPARSPFDAYGNREAAPAATVS